MIRISVLLICWLLFSINNIYSNNLVKSTLSFSTAGFYELPHTGREAYSMNIAWRFFKGTPSGDPFLKNYNDSLWHVVSLPHGIEYLPVEASGCINYQGIVWYRKHFKPEFDLKGKKLFLHFEAIMGKCKIWVNGILVKEHFGGYLPVIVDVSDLLDFQSDNVIAVMADNSDDPNYPVGKPQYMLDFTYFGGIYRDCWLVTHNNVFITNANYENEVAGGGVFVSYDKVSKKSAVINLKTHVRNSTSRRIKATVHFDLRTMGGKLVTSVDDNVTIRSGNAGHIVQQMKVQKPLLWSPDSPNLYYLDVKVLDENGEIVDGYRQKIGIRSIEFKQKDGLWINGEPYSGKMMGTNRHQDFAVLGNALPNTMQWRDAKKLRDAGMKVIRTHYVIDPAFMDACDELGLFALVEVPGWQFWNNKPIFAERVYQDIRDMIRLHRNHPSLFFWEPILNETNYPEAFAKRAHEICDEEYPYPYSYAACDGGAAGNQYYNLCFGGVSSNLDPLKTYFIREWGDNVDDWNAHNSNSRVSRNWGEVPMLLQAFHYESRYREIVNASKQIVGGCFWHSFDHQRGIHTDPFYGGMMDAFRQPKTSYYMFMSQRDKDKTELKAETGPMIHIAHAMTPFSPADITIFSNCDEVRLTIFEDGKQLIQRAQAKDGNAVSRIFTFEKSFDFMECKKLARAGKQQQCYLLAEGIVDGKVVVSEKRYPGGRADHIRLRLDDENIALIADGGDVVTVVAEMVDKYGNVKRLNNDHVLFTVEGEGRIIGDETIGTNPMPIVWGTAPVLVQSTTKAGKIKILAQVQFPGRRRPLEGVLEFESVPNMKKEIYCEEEVSRLEMNIDKLDLQTERYSSNQYRKLEEENRRLQKIVDEIGVKEVEMQQTKFGIGIND